MTLKTQSLVHMLPQGSAVTGRIHHLASLSTVLALRRPSVDHLLTTTLKSASSAPPLLPTAPCSSPNVIVNATLAYYLAVSPVSASDPGLLFNRFASIRTFLASSDLSTSFLTFVVCGFGAPSLTLIKLYPLLVVWY